MDLFTLIQVLQSLWIIFIVVILPFKYRIGIAAYLAYIFLVPYMKIDIGGFELQWNFLNLYLLFTFFLHEHKKVDFRPLLPFIVYFVIMLVMMPFQNGLPFSISLELWRIQVMKFMILPFVIWNDILENTESIKLYRRVTICCIIIAVLYGLYLTIMPGVNPYMIMVSAANGESFNFAYAAGYSGLGDGTINNDGTSLMENMSLSNSIKYSRETELSEGRLFGRISSVFSHPMMFGLFLGMSFLYIFINKKNISKWLFYTLFLLFFTNAIFCGVRTIIASFFIVVLYLLLAFRNLKSLLLVSVAFVILWFLSTEFPILGDYFSSMIDDSNSSVGGSSLEMRISQFKGCCEEIKFSVVEGKGFGWTSDYLSHTDGHPTILHFESLVFVVLCNSGIIGVLVWLLMTCMIVKFNNKNEPPIDKILNALFVFYVSYSCITGDYGYMQYFILFYILMLAENEISKKEKLYIRRYK